MQLGKGLAVNYHPLKQVAYIARRLMSWLINMELAKPGRADQSRDRIGAKADTRNHVLDIVEVYRGSVNTSQVRGGEIFKAAIRRNASALIVVHNHPSGDPTPSPVM